MSLNLGRHIGVQLSADLKLVEASTRFRIRWISAEIINKFDLHSYAL